MVVVMQRLNPPPSLSLLTPSIHSIPFFLTLCIFSFLPLIPVYFPCHIQIPRHLYLSLLSSYFPAVLPLLLSSIIPVFLHPLLLPLPCCLYRDLIFSPAFVRHPCSIYSLILHSLFSGLEAAYRLIVGIRVLQYHS